MNLKNAIRIVSSTSIASSAAIALAATAAAQQAKPAADESSLIAAPRTSNLDAPPKAAPTLPDLNSLFDASFPFIQAADDSSIYAVGKNYKARFTGAGLTYAPRGGQRMNLALESATIGGKPLSLKADAQPTHTAGQDMISIDRGAFVEQFAIKADSIEQTFTINQLPLSGDLVLHISANTPGMIATEKSASLEFTGDHGTVSYSNAVLVDSAGKRSGLTTGITNGTIEIRVPSAMLNRAAFPITIDPVISTVEVYGGTPKYRHPDVAYDASNDRFVVVTEVDASANDGDIYSVLVNPTGFAVPNTFHFVDVTFDNWRNPQVANNNIANRFMVVAERGAAPSRGVWGNTISAATGDVGTQFEIINGGGGEKIHPSIGGDSFLAPPTYFLVTWEWAFTPTDHNIAGRLLDANGNMVGSNLFLDLSAANQSNPSVSKSNLGGQWMVVWQSSFSASDEDIYGAKVNWDGQIAFPADVLDFNSVTQTKPKVSSPLPSGQYLIVYESIGAIMCRLVGNDMTTQYAMNLGGLGDNPFGQGCYEPSVDSDGDKFIVGYSEVFAGNFNDWDLYVDTICPSANNLHLAEIHKLLDSSTGRDQESAVATTWSAGGQAMGPVMFGWTHDRILPSDFGTIETGRYNAHNSCCPADCAPSGGNGVVNIGDLVAVITQWTTGATFCTTCTGDINGDLVVDIDDLVKVITGWGVCP